MVSRSFGVGPVTRISRCLPRGTTSWTVQPPSFSVANRGTRKSEARSSLPASAACSCAAARKTESPSGTDPQSFRGGVGAGLGQGGGDRGVQDAVAVDLFHDQLVHGAAFHHPHQGGPGRGKGLRVLAECQQGLAAALHI